MKWPAGEPQGVIRIGRTESASRPRSLGLSVIALSDVAALSASPTERGGSVLRRGPTRPFYRTSERAAVAPRTARVTARPVARRSCPACVPLCRATWCPRGRPSVSHAGRGCAGPMERRRPPDARRRPRDRITPRSTRRARPAGRCPALRPIGRWLAPPRGARQLVAEAGGTSRLGIPWAHVSVAGAPAGERSR